MCTRMCACLHVCLHVCGGGEGVAAVCVRLCACVRARLLQRRAAACRAPRAAAHSGRCTRTPPRRPACPAAAAQCAQEALVDGSEDVVVCVCQLLEDMLELPKPLLQPHLARVVAFCMVGAAAQVRCHAHCCHLQWRPHPTLIGRTSCGATPTHAGGGTERAAGAGHAGAGAAGGGLDRAVRGLASGRAHCFVRARQRGPAPPQGPGLLRPAGVCDSTAPAYTHAGISPSSWPRATRACCGRWWTRCAAWRARRPRKTRTRMALVRATWRPRRWTPWPLLCRPCTSARR